MKGELVWGSDFLWGSETDLGKFRAKGLLLHHTPSVSVLLDMNSKTFISIIFIVIEWFSIPFILVFDDNFVIDH